MQNILKQYQSIKEKYPGAVLLFRIGDFYETLNKDAKIVSKHSGILLQEVQATAGIRHLASVPLNAVDATIRKLVKAGYQVALCDQLEDPRNKRNIAKRGVTDLLKPS